MWPAFLVALVPAWTSRGLAANYVPGEAAALLSAWWMLCWGEGNGREWPQAQGYRDSTRLSVVSGFQHAPWAWAEPVSFPSEGYSTCVHSVDLHLKSSVGKADRRCAWGRRRGNRTSPSQKVFITWVLLMAPSQLTSVCLGYNELLYVLLGLVTCQRFWNSVLSTGCSNTMVLLWGQSLWWWIKRRVTMRFHQNFHLFFSV